MILLSKLLDDGYLIFLLFSFCLQSSPQWSHFIYCCLEDTIFDISSVTQSLSSDQHCVVCNIFLNRPDDQFDYNFSFLVH